MSKIRGRGLFAGFSLVVVGFSAVAVLQSKTEGSVTEVTSRTGGGSASSATISCFICRHDGTTGADGRSTQVQCEAAADAEGADLSFIVTSAAEMNTAAFRQSTATCTTREYVFFGRGSPEPCTPALRDTVTVCPNVEGTVPPGVVIPQCRPFPNENAARAFAQTVEQSLPAGAQFGLAIENDPVCGRIGQMYIRFDAPLPECPGVQQCQATELNKIVDCVNPDTGEGASMACCAVALNRLPAWRWGNECPVLMPCPEEGFSCNNTFTDFSRIECLEPNGNTKTLNCCQLRVSMDGSVSDPQWSADTCPAAPTCPAGDFCRNDLKCMQNGVVIQKTCCPDNTWKQPNQNCPLFPLCPELRPGQNATCWWNNAVGDQYKCTQNNQVITKTCCAARLGNADQTINEWVPGLTCPLPSCPSGGENCATANRVFSCRNESGISTSMKCCEQFISGAYDKFWTAPTSCVTPVQSETRTGTSVLTCGYARDAATTTGQAAVEAWRPGCEQAGGTFTTLGCPDVNLVSSFSSCSITVRCDYTCSFPNTDVI